METGKQYQKLVILLFFAFKVSSITIDFIRKYASSENKDGFKQLIKDFINLEDEDGQTPLYMGKFLSVLIVFSLKTYHFFKAAIRGHYDLVNYLWSKGADINCKNSDDTTPLHKG